MRAHASFVPATPTATPAWPQRMAARRARDRAHASADDLSYRRPAASDWKLPPNQLALAGAPTASTAAHRPAWTRRRRRVRSRVPEARYLITAPTYRRTGAPVRATSSAHADEGRDHPCTTPERRPRTWTGHPAAGTSRSGAPPAPRHAGLTSRCSGDFERPRRARHRASPAVALRKGKAFVSLPSPSPSGHRRPGGRPAAWRPPGHLAHVWLLPLLSLPARPARSRRRTSAGANALTAGRPSRCPRTTNAESSEATVPRCCRQRAPDRDHRIDDGSTTARLRPGRGDAGPGVRVVRQQIRVLAWPGRASTTASGTPATTPSSLDGAPHRSRHTVGRGP
ncbi:hypothetical protein SMICM17S_01143 [Streptomyces microflavus]